MNNLNGTGVTMFPEVPVEANATLDVATLFDVDRRAMQPLDYSAAALLVDRAIPIPGINDRFEGAGPDVGAFEEDGPTWRAGHDFENPPNPKYEPPTTPYRNRLSNGGLDRGRFATAGQPADQEICWRATGLRTARLEMHPGFNSPPANHRYSIQKKSVRLGPKLVEAEQGSAEPIAAPADGIEQRVEGLSPKTEYCFAGYTRHLEGVNVRFGLRGADGKVIASTDSATISLGKDQTWRHVRVRFITGPNQTSVTVFAEKRTEGTAHLDDMGLVPTDLIDRYNELSK